MSTNRAALYSKIHKVTKKHYKPSTPVGRTILEHLLHACCLENSRPEAADEAFAKLQLYADWNEVRVTSVSELAEVMSMLHDSGDSARRLKRTLQSVFETRYSFDLEHLKKLNLGKALSELESFQGVTPFAVAYVSQHGLGGHSIPASAGVYEVLVAVGAITESEAAAKRIPGMERAIPKTKGIEFASLLHQLGVDFQSSTSAKLKGILQEIEPNVEYPRREKKSEAAEAKPTKGSRRAAKSAGASKDGAPAGDKESARPARGKRAKDAAESPGKDESKAAAKESSKGSKRGGKREKARSDAAPKPARAAKTSAKQITKKKPK